MKDIGPPRVELQPSAAAGLIYPNFPLRVPLRVVSIFVFSLGDPKFDAFTSPLKLTLMFWGPSVAVDDFQISNLAIFYPGSCCAWWSPWLLRSAHDVDAVRR